MLELGFTDELIDSFVNQLKMSKVRSIDEFLEHRADYREIGKIAIAQAIIGCEPQFPAFDPLFHTTSAPGEVAKIAKRWYPQLLAALNCGLGLLEENKLSIVTFNYDRSLEHFLYSSWLARYGPSSEDMIVRAIRQLSITHVHGKLGNLPWETDGHVRAYGQRKNASELRASGNLISIVHEGDRQSREFTRARNLFADSDRIFFLGFGYHQSNLRRLGVEGRGFDSKTFLGTRAGLEDLEVRNLGGQFESLGNLPRVPNVEIHDFLRRVVNLDGELTLF